MKTKVERLLIKFPKGGLNRMRKYLPCTEDNSLYYILENELYCSEFGVPLSDKSLGKFKSTRRGDFLEVKTSIYKKFILFFDTICYKLDDDYDIEDYSEIEELKLRLNQEDADLVLKNLYKLKGDEMKRCGYTIETKGRTVYMIIDGNFMNIEELDNMRNAYRDMVNYLKSELEIS